MIGYRLAQFGWCILYLPFRRFNLDAVYTGLEQLCELFTEVPAVKSLQGSQHKGCICLTQTSPEA